MSVETFVLPKAVEGDLAADLEKQGAYVSPEIKRVKVRPDGKTIEFELTDGANATEVKAKMERYATTMVSRYRKLPQKILQTFTRKDTGPLETNVYKQLLEKGWVVELGRGQLSLNGPALNVLREIDREATESGLKDFGAVEEVYPTLIPAKTMGRCGYFASFPQSINMVTHLVEDYDLIDEFRTANLETTDLKVPRKEALTHPEACLSPAVCYHCYRGLEGKSLPKGPKVVTAVGKCFRYESTNLTGLDRLWDFTMREIIFVGTDEEVSTRRQKGIELAARQLEKWDLEAHIESANDPFFSAAYATKTYYQVRGDLKFELRLTIEPGASGEKRTLACESFNLHENFFGQTFSITASNSQPAFTGCVAWGLERWVLACFVQHGFDPKRWPAAVRDKVFG